MSEQKQSHFHIPKLDLSWLDKPLTKEECDKAVTEFNKGISQKERLAIVEDIEKHPEHLLSWDMDITFEEYARRVRAGDYD